MGPERVCVKRSHAEEEVVRAKEEAVGNLVGKIHRGSPIA